MIMNLLSSNRGNVIVINHDLISLPHERMHQQTNIDVCNKRRQLRSYDLYTSQPLSSGHSTNPQSRDGGDCIW
jgi:hypothetical protein